MELINVKEMVDDIKIDLKARVDKIAENNDGYRPMVIVISIGDDKASETYIKNKKKVAEELDIICSVVKFKDDCTQSEVEELIDLLNNNINVDGVILQLPIPKHLDEQKLTQMIAPHKDVDGFNYINTGALFSGGEGFRSCTPMGAMEILKRINMEDLSGKKAVVIGRSNIVGKPMAHMLMEKNATVTICHSRTDENCLINELRSADIIVSAVGKANFIKSYMVKDGAVVIDVGINRDDNGKLVGDVDRESLSHIDCRLTPVPSGVGLTTVVMLMKSVVEAAENNLK